MKLLIATRSSGKAREIRSLFAGLPITLVFPDDLGLTTLPEEDAIENAATYAANATAKARYFARRSGLAAVADDSGLEVDALHGEPGVHSARWAAGRGGKPEAEVEQANNRLLLERMSGVPEAARTARYRCVVVHVPSADGPPSLVEATCEGRILETPRGAGGFGYDPLFWSADLGMSFGEAPEAAKHRVSHRGRALRALIELLLRRAV